MLGALKGMDTGTLISGIGHLGVILWLLLGGFFFTPDPPRMPETAEVSIVSESEFAAMSAAAPAPSAQSEAPAQTAPARTIPAPPRPQPAATPEPPVERVPSPQPPQQQAFDAPQPPQQAPVENVPPPQPVIAPAISDKPKPRPVQRVAPTPTEAPPPDARTAQTRQDEVRPDPAAQAQEVKPAQQATAPEEATSQIVTEATQTDEQASAPPPVAPSTSAPPRHRPKETKPAPTQTAAAETASQPNAKPTTDAIADAVAAAVSQPDTPRGTGGNGRAASGPPVTSGDKDAFRVAVQACWNVGSLSSEALRTTVIVGFSMTPDGKPVSSSMQMVEYSGGSEAAARQAYEAARRAIIRCGADGYGLPPEKYDHWRDVELVFNPEGMRMK